MSFVNRLLVSGLMAYYLLATSAFSQGVCFWPGIQNQLYPATLWYTCENQQYQDFTKFDFNQDTIFMGNSMVADSFEVNIISGMPTGWSFDCDQPGCKYYRDSVLDRIWGCLGVSGLSPAPFGGGTDIELSIEKTWYFSPFGSALPVRDTLMLSIPMLSAPNVSWNSAQTGPLTVTFQNPNPSPGYSPEWDFGDGTTDYTSWNPTHTYAAPGSYVVCHIAAFECWATQCDTVIVTPVGIADEWENQLRIATMPHGSGWVVSGVPAGAGRVEAALYDLAGRKIWAGTFGNGLTNRIPGEGLPEGLFLLRLDTGTLILTRKLLRKK